MKHFACCILMFILGVTGLAACSQPGSGSSARGVSIEDSWARPAQAGDNTAVYFVIENANGDEDTLLSAACSGAKACELHLSAMDASGTMKMTRQDKVSIPKNEKVTFQPGGLHVVVMKVQKTLKVGDTFSVTLNFEKAGAVTVEAPVREQQE